MDITTTAHARSGLLNTWRSIPTLVKYGLPALAVAYVPIAIGEVYWRHIFTFIALYVVLGMGLNIVVGYAGLLDLGYIAFYGIGAYTIAILTAKFELVPFWVAFPIAVVLAAIFGILLGAPTLRLRPDYLAMVTLGFGEIVRLAFLNLDPLTGGPPGITSIPRPDFLVFQIRNAGQLYWVVVALAILITWVTYRLGNSRIGRGWSYTREDEIAAEASGIDTIRMKLLAFSLGAAFAGLAGVFFATNMTMVAPESFTWWESLIVLIIVVLGGMGSIPGVLLGASVMVAMPEVLREFAEWRLLILGVILIGLALFRPKGLWPAPPRKVPAAAHALATARESGTLARFKDGEIDAPPPPDPGQPIMEVGGVSKRFGGVAALSNVSLQIFPGQIVSLIGPNGAGKTTLLNVITGIYPPTAGSVAFVGNTLTGLRPYRVAKLGVARTFQNVRLFSELTLLENVAAGLHCRTHAGPLAAVLTTPAQRAEELAIWKHGLDLLDFVGLRERAEDFAKNLPYGDQRRLEIARALATGPRLLILDEPAAGLSSQERLALMELIRGLRTRGITVLLIEHDMDFVMNISDRVFVLDYGVLIAQGTPEEVQNDPKVIEAYLGREDEE